MVQGERLFLQLDDSPILATSKESRVDAYRLHNGHVFVDNVLPMYSPINSQLV